MERDPRAFLWDVAEAARAIAEFTQDLDAEGYSTTPLVRAAVERQFQIIGEALNRLAKAAPELARRVPDLEQIVSFRNVLVHGYAAIDHARVWEISVTLLPGLQETVADLLAEVGPPEP
jgi:uncharacterized protein with HEPN domain